ncbi:MAG TPA: IS21 family transposase, partial [Streptosporangiaceae bacterium]|nr:IS21 family transposase [Streptosporangiaceae bacterium]
AATGVAQTTVCDYVGRARAAGVGWPLPADLDDEGLERLLYPPAAPSRAARPAPDWGYVHRELRRKGVTLQLLWLEYRQAHPDGYGYSQFCNLYRAWTRQVDVVMRQVHRAGEKLFVDFPGDKVPVCSRETGEVVLEAELFVAVAGASSYLYAEAFPSQELLYWVTAHVHCFEALAGCPAIVVCDNLRAGVTRPHRYEPDVNATFAEMAAHYRVAVIPARAYKPRDKAKAESGVLIAERWIIARLRDRRFYSLGEANAAIAACVAEINARPFQKLDGTRRLLFEQLDRPALRPLPATRYEFATWHKARVNIDYHIAADKHYYSVPYQLARQQVDVRLSAAAAEIFHGSRRVASHVRSHVRHGHTTDPAHMPESHRQHAAWTPQRITGWAARTGPATANLVEKIIASRPHPEQGYRAALGIIRLAGRYGPDRAEAACARALRLRAYSYRSVESILRTGLDRQPLPGGTPALPPHPAHVNVRGPDYYN